MMLKASLSFIVRDKFVFKMGRLRPGGAEAPSPPCSGFSEALTLGAGASRTKAPTKVQHAPRDSA